MLRPLRLLVLAFALVLSTLPLAAQPAHRPVPKPPPLPWLLSPEERQRLNELTAQDHADMMRQLGITALRPGRSPGNKPDETNPANYDPAKANPDPDYPDPLVLNDGRKVDTADLWWKVRRPEIVEGFEREVYGRVPAQVPPVEWEVVETVSATVGGRPVIAKQVVGHVDNSADPAISVDILMAVVTPAEAKRPVPALVMFGSGNLPGVDPGWPKWAGPEPHAPPSPDQLIAAGWGYVSLNPTTVQPDNGAGLTQGIIGLVNHGQHRKPEDWGALRAWAWGAGRALDFLATDPAIDAKKVGIEGVSRYGKAALVTMAFDPRFAVVLVGSSGEGGAKPHRRNFGEAVENLTGSGGYHWMAGNFLKYGAEQATFGRKTPGDLPVDANDLIALCAPRPTFISYGIPERGDAHWLDHQGSYMATVSAGAVFRLLGVKDLGVTDDYHVAQMPPVNHGLLGGTLAWRQHDGGHEDRTNMEWFLAWANHQLRHWTPADAPEPRLDANSLLAHEQLLAKAKQGGIDLYFVGDSITRRWGATDYPDMLADWNRHFHGWNAGDFGWGADRTQNILWRLDHGELDGVNPKAIVILAGTNNVGRWAGDEARADDIAKGIEAIVDTCRAKAPSATIILTAIFPRNDSMAGLPTIERVNARIAKLADGKTVRFLNVNDRFAGPDGVLHDGLTVDKLHPSVKGYDLWAAGLEPILTEVLGPRAATDHAPPPTGDPSAAKKS